MFGAALLWEGRPFFLSLALDSGEFFRYNTRMNCNSHSWTVVSSSAHYETLECIHCMQTRIVYVD